MLVDLLGRWLKAAGLKTSWSEPLAHASSLIVLIVCAWIANWLAKRVILRVVSSIIRRTPLRWDDVLLKNGVFTRLSHIAPALVLTLGEKFLLREQVWTHTLRTAVNVYLVLILLLVLDAALDAVVDLYNQGSTRNVPLKGFTQGAKLVAFLLGGIFMLSLMLGRSPLYFLSGLGALTAVLLLIFKDALLGLVAGVQLSVNRVVQIGDWIEMPKYNADGFVIDVSLTIVKVQNWDKTITSVPTYALTSEPVKNWRGMQESGGRRIKRAIYLDMTSFRFLDDELLERLLKLRRLRPYLEEKLAEINAWNAGQAADGGGLSANQRRLTNVGTFRAYVSTYLSSHPDINQEMTLLVRHLAPYDKGLPLEIYAFTSDVRWAVYERVQADIFDHLLTLLPEFDLRVYQSPSGRDLRELGSGLGEQLALDAPRTGKGPEPPRELPG